MASNKRYYWLKLPNTYFSKITQKKMKCQERGREMQVIYLSMMLSSIDKDGFIYYQGVCDSISEELAIEYDESVELIQTTLNYLEKNKLIFINENSDCYIPESLQYVGSESDSAERVRKFREKTKSLQCNNEPSHCNANVTMSNTEIEKELEIREGNNTNGVVSEKDNVVVEKDNKNTNKNKEKSNINLNMLIAEYTQNECLIETLKDFLKMREAIKKPMTDRALKIMLKKLKGLSEDEDIQVKILEQSIFNSWQGIFPLKDQSEKNTVNHGTSNIEDMF